MHRANNSVKIHLTEPARSKAAIALFPLAGVPAYDAGARRIRDEFTGPDFKGCVKEVELENEYIAVTLRDGTMYVYAMRNIDRMKAYHTPAE